MKISRKIIFAALLSAAAYCSLPYLAFAHATPVQYVPDASSIVAQAPSSVQIHFSERIESAVSSISVLGPDGSRVDLGNPAVDANDPRLYGVGIKDGGKGTYTVSWQVISADDGHFTKGAYVFSVGNESAAAANVSGGFQIVHSSSVPEAATLALELVGDAMILGAFIIFAFIWRPARKKHFAEEMSAHERQFERRFRMLVVIGGILALAGGISYLIYKTNELATLQETAFSAVFLPFLGTTAALYTVYRMAGVALILIVFAVNRKKIFLSGRMTNAEYASFAVLALIDYARARVSHAAASTFAPETSIFLNFVHLLFKDSWIGGIIALVVLLSPIVKKLRDLRIAAFILTNFSRITSAALGIAGMTGVYVVWLHLKSFSNILTTDWGKGFAMLSAFAVLLMALRFFHQLYLEPKLVKALQGKGPMPKGFSLIGFTLPAEMVVGIAILAVTSLLIITSPPITPHYSFSRDAVSQGVELTLTEHPYEKGEFLVTAQDPATKDGIDLKGLSVTLTNQAQGIGPISATLDQRFVGGYVFPENLMSPAGDWKVDISAQRTGGYDAVASFSVNYPQEVQASDAHAEDRTFGAFEALNVFGAIVILALAIFLYRMSTKLNRLTTAEEGASAANASVSFLHRAGWIPGFVAVAAVLYITGGIPALYGGILKSPFEQACEKANIMDVWHESVPERNGQATSDLAVPGCSVGIGLGQYHFADAREFAYFERPAKAQAQLATTPSVIEPNVSTTLTFTLRDQNGDPVRDLVLDHNRIMHVIIASKDFSVFSHIHVEDSGPVTADMLKNAVFPVHYSFPKPGYYMVSVDFEERAYLFSYQFYVNVGNADAMGGPVNENLSLDQNFDGYQVSLATSPSTLKAGAPATLYYHVEEDGKPVTDMNPYLAVPMHISIIRDDLQSFLHIHGLLPVSFVGKLLGESIHASHLFLPDKFGPDIEATNFTFASPGRYDIFGEFSRGGKITVTRFVVDVQ